MTGGEGGGSSPLHADLPAWVPVIEVLGILSYGRADGFTDDAISRISARWDGDQDITLNGDPLAQPFAQAIRCLRIRERWWRARKRRRCPVPALPPNRRAQVRAAWHRHGRRPLHELLSELLADTSAYRQAVADREATLRRTTAEFIAKAMENGIVVYGLQGNHERLQLTSDNHVKVNLRLFANSRRIITADNWTTIGYDPRHAGPRKGRGDYGDLKISRLHLLRLLPVPPPLMPEAPIAQLMPPDVQQSAHRTRTWGGQDHRKSDDPLAQEIIDGVDKGQFLNDWVACGALAGRADGKGSPESKQKRLSIRVKMLRKNQAHLDLPQS